MAFGSGKSAVVLVGGYDLSGYFNKVGVKRTKTALDVTCFGATSKSYLSGTRDGSLTVAGFHDASSASAVDTRLHAMFTSAADTPVTASPFAATIGGIAYLATAQETDLAPAESDVAGTVTTSATFTPDGGIDSGAWHKALAAVTTGGVSASVDNGASSANGGVANLHATAFSGTSITPKIAHSANDSSYADLITFTAVSGVTSEQKTVSGTVERYTRDDHATGSFTSCTYAVAFARR